MCSDPVVRSDPRDTSTVPAALPVAIDEFDDESDDSDDSDEEGLAARQKEKCRNKVLDLEQGWERLWMSCLNLPLASFWDAIQRIGHYERDNNMCNMLSGSFHVVEQNNTFYHWVHQGAQIAIETRGLPAAETSRPSKQFDKASPCGMPLTTWEVKQLIKLLRNEYGPYYD